MSDVCRFAESLGWDDGLSCGLAPPAPCAMIGLFVLIVFFPSFFSPYFRGCRRVLGCPNPLYQNAVHAHVAPAGGHPPRHGPAAQVCNSARVSRVDPYREECTVFVSFHGAQ